MKGFTLIEVVISVSILALLGVLAALIFFGSQRDTDVSAAAQKIAATLREAQTRSMSGEQTSTWGVQFSTSIPTENFFSLFHGASYASATATTTTYLPANLRFSNITLNGGGFEIRFDRLTGKTSQYGTGASSQALCVTNDQEPSACKKSIRVTAQGRIDWQ